MYSSVESKGMIGSVVKMDLAGKFSVAIIIGLVILFTMASTIMLNQQSTALDNLLSASKEVQASTLEKQSAAATAAIRENVKQLVRLLTKIAPMPIAEMDLSELAGYAEEVTAGNKSISFVEILNAEGKTFASDGNKENVDPKNIIEAKIDAEGMHLGKVIVGYNFDALNTELAQIRKDSEANIRLMSVAKDDALSSAKINMSLILVLIVVAVSMLSYFLFKFIVQTRLVVLEARLKDIAEGEGDLTKRIEVDGNDAIDRLGKYFNKFLSTIHDTITKVVAATGQLTTASEQMAIITEEAKQDVMQQKSEIDQAATAMNEMTATVQEVARNAALAADSAYSADEEAKQGLIIVNETIESINALAKEVVNAAEVIGNVQEDSQQIGAVLVVIRGVAEQTNLLALNAAIEAARAGDQGRGFAVVADEVRVLAQRTQKSTEEIHEMIEKLQTGAINAVQVMEQGRNQAKISVDKAAKAGESLHVITSAVSQITDMNTQIASAAEEQTVVGEDINRNIVSIRDVADKTADGSHSIAMSSEELSKLSIDLQRLIGKFKI